MFEDMLEDFCSRHKLGDAAVAVTQFFGGTLCLILFSCGGENFCSPVLPVGHGMYSGSGHNTKSGRIQRILVPVYGPTKRAENTNVYVFVVLACTMAYSMLPNRPLVCIICPCGCILIC
jgi:hypothetical protein